MPNLKMIEKVKSGEAISVHDCEREGNFYVLKEFIEDVDYCNVKDESWIWSIGKRLSDGKVLASHGTDFYMNDKFECLFLR